MFAGALLLESLILFNNQKSECLTQVGENPGIEHIELQAEVPSNSATESFTGLVFVFNSGKLKYLKNLDFTNHQVRIKTQMQIHLELKPVLGMQSGQNLYYRTSYDDPPAN